MHPYHQDLHAHSLTCSLSTFAHPFALLADSPVALWDRGSCVDFIRKDEPITVKIFTNKERILTRLPISIDCS